jgi:hypothetical protein
MWKSVSNHLRLDGYLHNGSDTLSRIRASGIHVGRFPFTSDPSLFSIIRMDSTRSSQNTATHSASTAAGQEQIPATTPSLPSLNMDDATICLVVTDELEEARSLVGESNGTSDCAMARRFAVDQLLSCRTINHIKEMTDADIARTVLLPPTAADTCTCCEDPLDATKAWQTPCEHW